MELKEAMELRHTVRKYLDKDIPTNIIKQLNERLSINNSKFNLKSKLIINDQSALNPIIKLILTKGVKNYIVLAGDDSIDLDERLGYMGADMMLYAQTLGLNSWWVGGTYNRGKVSQKVDNSKTIGIISIGYGETQGIPHKSKNTKEVSIYEGNEPDWFKNGVKAALLAPTALNKQDFLIKGKNNEVNIECKKSIFAGSNLGLVKYHFELGASINNFHWIKDKVELK